jgi:hypothetical protein
MLCSCSNYSSPINVDTTNASDGYCASTPGVTRLCVHVVRILCLSMVFLELFLAVPWPFRGCPMNVQGNILADHAWPFRTLKLTVANRGTTEYAPNVQG